MANAMRSVTKDRSVSYLIKDSLDQKLFGLCQVAISSPQSKSVLQVLLRIRDKRSQLWVSVNSKCRLASAGTEETRIRQVRCRVAKRNVVAWEIASHKVTPRGLRALRSLGGSMKRRQRRVCATKIPTGLKDRGQYGEASHTQECTLPSKGKAFRGH